MALFATWTPAPTPTLAVGGVGEPLLRVVSNTPPPSLPPADDEAPQQDLGLITVMFIVLVAIFGIILLLLLVRFVNRRLHGARVGPHGARVGPHEKQLSDTMFKTPVENQDCRR